MKIIPIDITSEQRANFLKLIAYFEKGELKAEFTMEQYSSYLMDNEQSETDCGTIGCFAGHGPYAGIEKKSSETWTEYIDRCFSCTQGASDWMFSVHWWRIDNTHTGALKRAKFFIENGGVPENYIEQLWGLSPLSY